MSAVLDAVDTVPVLEACEACGSGGQAGALGELARARLRVEDVSLDYRAERGVVRATHRVGFDVMPSERFVLLGASGCGKSSLLKAVGGFLAPSEGRILVDGAPVSGPGPDRIAVFQEFDQLPPWKTVLENVAFPLIASGAAPRKLALERAREWLARVGLADFASAYPHQLSGGMKQRVAIARALAMKPRVLLMDEPFAALDALTRRRMQDELLALWEQERFTLLFVTHSIEEALIVGHRVLVLSPHPGRVRAELNAQGLTPSQRARQANRIEQLLFGDEPAEPGSEAVPSVDDAVTAERVAAWTWTSP